MQKLSGKVAVVAGASRGAGRGIALALGAAGATVYVAGRTTRAGPAPRDGAPGTIEDTAEQVTSRGGVGIPVCVDLTKEVDVGALFEQVQREQGTLDVLVNAVWGASDGVSNGEDMMASWSRPFWEQTADAWQHMIDGGPRAYFLASHQAMRIMAKQKKGLIIGITDGIMDGVSDDVLTGAVSGDYQGQLVWSLAHDCINRLMRGMSQEAKKHNVAVITLMPGFMRTERVVGYLEGNDKMKKMFRFDLSETTEYVGRAVAALSADRQALKKTGRIHFVADLAAEYGFTDVDGRHVPRFQPYG
jgi:NAD(P)-dependent dehydrogenase (short-subunit alcohol dehydrogenase family)